MTSHPINKLKFKTQDESRYGKQVHSGYLLKKSKGKSWTKRYAVLWEDLALRFYEQEDRGSVIGKIKLKKVDEVKEDNSEDKSIICITSTAQNKCSNDVNVSSYSMYKAWQFGCDDSNELSEWIHILQSALKLKKQNEEKKKAAEEEQNEVKETKEVKTNRYIGHHGHNLSNLEEFSIAHSQSSRMSSIQSLSALAIMTSPVDEDNELDFKPKRRSFMESPIIEDMEMEEDDDDILEFELNRMRTLNVEETLKEENQHIVFESILERKTNQKVFGKHLWETRYFKLSTHTLSIYTNDKANITESVIKLSSIISVNRNTKNNGSELKSNRFDIVTKDKTLNLRTIGSDNDELCSLWLNHLSNERKNHRKSIRTGLEVLEFRKALNKETKAKDKQDQNDGNDENMEERQRTQSDNKGRFKRERTRRKGNGAVVDEEEEAVDEAQQNDEDEFDENYDPKSDMANGQNAKKQNQNHSRNLSLRTWAKGVDSIALDIKKQNNLEKEQQNKNAKLISRRIESFEGFLIRSIGHSQTNIGEKLYCRLSDDMLEFSCIEEGINDAKDLEKLHSANMVETIGIEFIKSVKMTSDEQDEFIIVFDENDSSTDWTLKTTKSDKERVKEWVDVLKRAQTAAAQIAKTINTINAGEDEEEEDDDECGGNKSRKAKKRKMGGLQALQKMINDETMEELEMAQFDANNVDQANGFEITKIPNREPTNETKSCCNCCVM